MVFPESAARSTIEAMKPPPARWSILLSAAAIVFGASVAVGLKLLPEPRSDADYLVVGSIATLLSLATLFAVLLLTVQRDANPFFRRRPKRGADSEE